MKINNRRYVGSKTKLMPWIKESLESNCYDCHSFFDVFAGTGIVSYECLTMYDSFVINDFLYSNEIIYRAFFEQKKYSSNKLKNIKIEYNNVKAIESNYVSNNYGDKFFSMNDAKKIGFIREDIEKKKNTKEINLKEYNILVASLIYSLDKISNTVGHYEAYIKNSEFKDMFVFDLIEPIKTSKKIRIYREDSNTLSKKIKADIVFIDPPYNSRQYSRFYHVLETIVKWDKPELFGVAMKPKEENMSEYCKNSAPKVFEDLINNLKCKYIVVTYNNTYNSKSTSSMNKITLEEIEKILKNRGETKIFSHKYNAFNAGKTDFENHQELLFITEVPNG